MKATSGSFQICFVIGEAGSGKTTLLNGFASLIDEIMPEAIVVFGECDAQIGISDPYLPFREILSLLIGDTETGKSQWRLSPKITKKLGNFAATSIETLLEIGPDLIGNIIPGGVIIAKSIKFFSDKSEVMKKIKQRIDNPTNTEISQSTIFQEYTNFLINISKKKPVVIILDDLHWIDNASSALLFHLTRKLTDSKIMIIGTYRPNEILSQAEDGRHSMEEVTHEIKRYFGDVWIDLDTKSREENLEFTNMLINIEPNRLSDAFREKLYSLTEGNALFTSELLRNMKEKGDLILNEQGKWVESRTLKWKEIPAKVEGVIEERISRLEKELRDALSIASVEGENFTAQVIGNLRMLNERQIIHELSEELEKKHKLIKEDGELKVGQNFLSIFRFSHSLIHQYLYNELGLSERRILHKEIAQTLEVLYQNQIDLASIQLARHYEEAGELEKAIFYLTLAADKALRISAFREAKLHLEKALKLGTADVTTLLTLHLQLGLVLFGMGDYATSLVNLNNCLQQAQIASDKVKIANCKLHLSRTLSELGEFKLAERHIRECIDISKPLKQDEVLIKGYSQLAYVLYSVGEVEQAKKLLLKSLSLEKKAEKRLGHVWKVHSLYTLGSCEIVLNNPSKAEAAFLEGIQVAKTLGNRELESYNLTDLGYVLYEKGDYEQAKLVLMQGLTLGKEIDAQWTIAEALCGLGFVNASIGNYEESENQIRDALRIFNESQSLTGILLSIVSFAHLLVKKDRLVEALQLIGLTRQYSTPIADTDHFSNLVLVNIKDKITEDIISKEIEGGKSLSFEGTIQRLLS